MAEAALRHWTVDAFFAWQERQSEHYELVGGFPLKLMAGASNRHDRIVINILSELRNRLRGGACAPFSGDGAVQTRPGQIRRPDAGVDCGRRDPDGYLGAEPRMVAEVLSPSTRDFDSLEKLAEYKEVETLDYILYIEPNSADAMLWARDADRAWRRTNVNGLEAEVEMTGLGLSLPMAEIYEGVEFPVSPRLGLRPPTP